MAKSMPRSAGYRILHTVLCVIGALLLLFCISNTIALRTLSSNTALTDQLRSARLSDAGIPFTGKTVSEYIMKNYVTDANILPEDISAAVDGMEIPPFLADKLEQHFALLRGDSDTPVRIAPEEISALLERITGSLRESCKLIIDETDQQLLREAVEPALNTVNSVSELFGSNAAGRAFQRFGVSVWAYVLEVILLILLIRRWAKIRTNSGKDTAGAFKGFGLTALIPCAFGLLLVIIGGVHTLFIKDGTVGLYGASKVVRSAYWYIQITGVTFALFLLSLARYLRTKAVYRAAHPENIAKKPAVMPSAPAVPVRTVPCIKCGRETEAGSKFCKYCGAKQEQEKPAAPAPQSTAAGTAACVSCGKEIAANMKFCKYCGTNQQSGENIVDAVLNGTAGLPEVPDENSDTEK